MTHDNMPRSRRAILSGGLGALSLVAFGASAICAEDTAPDRVIRVSKQPKCGCCTKWVDHLQSNGFSATSVEVAGLDALKARLGVPKSLASCHTAEIDGYVIEGHVPAAAITRLLAERPKAIGLAVPGMPVGSPGMEGGEPEIYDVILFTRDGTQSFGRFRGDQQIAP
ncbi:MAG: DUF411 domain-containing protein [Hyphomicrobium sp.]